MTDLRVECIISGTIPQEEKENLRRAIQISLLEGFRDYGSSEGPIKIEVDCKAK